MTASTAIVTLLVVSSVSYVCQNQVAQSELDRVRVGYEEERRRREAELRERHQVVQLRKQIKDQADRCGEPQTFARRDHKNIRRRTRSQTLAGRDGCFRRLTKSEPESGC